MIASSDFCIPMSEQAVHCRGDMAAALAKRIASHSLCTGEPPVRPYAPPYGARGPGMGCGTRNY